MKKKEENHAQMSKYFFHLVDLSFLFFLSMIREPYQCQYFSKDLDF